MLVACSGSIIFTCAKRNYLTPQIFQLFSCDYKTFGYKVNLNVVAYTSHEFCVCG